MGPPAPEPSSIGLGGLGAVLILLRRRTNAVKYFLELYIVAESLGNSFGQGLINFYNTPNTLISVSISGVVALTDGPVGEWEFALLTSPVGANNFSFAGVYATNTTTPGVISGGSGVAVPGWAAGTARDFAVFGWGPGSVVYNPSWLKPDLSLGSNYPENLGVSLVATGTAGGVTSSGIVPTLNLFGPSSIQSGFIMGGGIPVPEPSSIALLGLGAAALLTRYRRKKE